MRLGRRNRTRRRRRLRTRHRQVRMLWLERQRQRGKRLWLRQRRWRLLLPLLPRLTWIPLQRRLLREWASVLSRSQTGTPTRPLVPTNRLGVEVAHHGGGTQGTLGEGSDVPHSSTAPHSSAGRRRGTGTAARQAAQHRERGGAEAWRLVIWWWEQGGRVGMDQGWTRDGHCMWGCEV